MARGKEEPQGEGRAVEGVKGPTLAKAALQVALLSCSSAETATSDLDLQFLKGVLLQ